MFFTGQKDLATTPDESRASEPGKIQGCVARAHTVYVCVDYCVHSGGQSYLQYATVSNSFAVVIVALSYDTSHVCVLKPT